MTALYYSKDRLDLAYNKCGATDRYTVDDKTVDEWRQEYRCWTLARIAGWTARSYTDHRCPICNFSGAR